MRVAVVGVGLIGGSIGLAARERLGARVIGVDSSPATLERALELGAVDETADEVGAAVDGADVVFCSVPLSALEEAVGAAIAASGEETVVTDVGSIKRHLIDVLPRAGGERFVGGHPLAGAETSGVGHARADLFDGARWYLTPTERTSGVLYERLTRLVSELGARPQAIDAAEHDRAMAVISHAPHVVANALAVRAAAELGELAPSDAGPSFRDATRVAGANPPLWASIYTANSETIAREVEGLAGELSAAARMIRRSEAGELERWQARAAQARAGLAEADSDAGPLVEVRALVENRPGVVAEIALALGRAQINIEDLALRPAADGRSGAVSVWVRGAEEAGRAIDVVGELGHSASLVEAAP